MFCLLLFCVCFCLRCVCLRWIVLVCVCLTFDLAFAVFFFVLSGWLCLVCACVVFLLWLLVAAFVNVRLVFARVRYVPVCVNVWLFCDWLCLSCV